MTIRPMSIRDYPAVRALWESAEGVGLSDSDSLDGVGRVLERNPGLSFVAEEGDQIVGAILVGHDGRRGLIHHLVVAPSFQRQGLGRALLHRALQGLRGAGIGKAHLLVFAGNASGKAFWQKIGAVERVELVLFSIGTASEG